CCGNYAFGPENHREGEDVVPWESAREFLPVPGGSVAMRWIDLLAAVIGALLGLIVDGAGWMPPPPRPPPAVTVDPLPHLVPKSPGGVALRLAMVHDILHERFPRHGRAYYTQRNRAVRDELAGSDRTRQQHSPTDRHFALLDDLGSGLDHLGDDDEAVRLL